MNKKIINTILLSMCSINVLSAAPLLNATAKSAAESTITQSTLSDVNFSGRWESDTCMGGHLSALNIVQDNQDYIQLDNGDIAVIGTLGTSTTTSSRPRVSTPEGNIFSIDWNSDKTTLFIRSVYVEKVPAAESNASKDSPADNLHLGVNYMSLSLNKDGQLLFKAKGTRYRDLQQVDEWDAPVCVFNKVADAPEPKVSPLTTLKNFRK